MDKIPKQSQCVHCGNNPAPHLLNWYNESLSILLAPLRQRLLFNRINLWLKKRGAGQKLAWAAFKLGEFFKVIRRQNRRELCKVSRAKVLWEEAEKRGVKMYELLLIGKPFDTYIAEKGEHDKIPNSKYQIPNKFQNSNSKKTIIFSGLPRPRNDHNSVLDLMDDKWFLKKLFLKNRLPVPAGAAATTFRQARQVFRRVTKPVIVKPRTGSRGRHSTTFVYTEEDLKKAFRVAKQLCHWVMVEEQLFGPVFRATLINCELCGVLRGDPPQVAGDGVHAISELIKQKNEQKNERPHPGVKDVAVDARMEFFLAYQDLKLSSIPKAGQTVDLSEKIGINYGGSSSEDFDICHPENKELFERAAKALGDPIVGFDFIIPDITKSWRGQRCGFIEANSLPFINLHHDPLLGKPRNIAAAVWDMVGM